MTQSYRAGRVLRDRVRGSLQLSWVSFEVPFFEDSSSAARTSGQGCETRRLHADAEKCLRPSYNVLFDDDDCQFSENWRRAKNQPGNTIGTIFFILGNPCR